MKKSIQNLKSVKYLSLMAIFITIKIVMSSFFIPLPVSSGNLRVYFIFLIAACEACIIGPIPALISGFVGDILGFLIHPSGPFFFGYVISSMLGLFIYAIFLYNKKITIIRIIIAKLSVNLFVNAILGSVWTTMMFSKGFIFYFTTSLIKNTILLPFEILLLVILFKAVIPTLEKKKLIIKQSPNILPFK
ncbi:MAG: folate family ECF transporter S component [Anaerorhabdus sp.]